MTDTKENILHTALRLFARDGYEAVSVSQISGELGMTKGALYKHYKNKRDLFDSILGRMNQMDYESSKKYEMPEGTIDQMPEAYGHTPIDKITNYTEAQFRHWTEEEFSSNFRKMLTLEQYRNEEMSALYQQYLVAGPLQYMVDLFGEITGRPENANMFALSFYAPVFMLYSLYDGTENKDEVFAMLHTHIGRVTDEMSQ